MLYSNTTLTPIKRELEFGTIFQVQLGESGRGRKLLSLCCPENTVIEKGMNKDLTIGITKSGRPRISPQTDVNLYLLLSSEGGYTRRGNGWIGWYNGNTSTVEVIARGNGADGDAGRIGQWDCVLLHVDGALLNDWIIIQPGGAVPTNYLHISRKGVVALTSKEDAMDYADIQGIDFPSDIISNCREL